MWEVRPFPMPSFSLLSLRLPQGPQLGSLLAFLDSEQALGSLDWEREQEWVQVRLPTPPPSTQGEFL